MNSKDRSVGNFISWGNSSSGFLRECIYCQATIYLKQDFDGRWRPYESWAEGKVEEGTWVLHTCNYAIAA